MVVDNWMRGGMATICTAGRVEGDDVGVLDNRKYTNDLKLGSH